MFIISLNYKKPIAEVEKHLEAHRAFLEELIENDPFKIHDVATYEITEFTPTKSQPDILQRLI
ncbi:MAG: YCII-related [Gammaproteobacteria bacterium]|jgi:uncharacterized protein YciI|nr:YCII-related [Gammaproteobacteria bacterium]